MVEASGAGRHFVDCDGDCEGDCEGYMDVMDSADEFMALLRAVRAFQEGFGTDRD